MEQSLKEKLLNAMKSRGVKVPKLSRATGIPADRIYKWFQQGTNPKEEDSMILEKWIFGEDSMNVSEKSHQNDSKAFYGHEISMASYTDLIQINKNLSAAQRQAEENRKELIDEVRAIRIAITGGFDPKTMQVVEATLNGLREFAVDCAMKQKQFHSRDEALAAFRKKRDEFLPKIEQGGTRTDLGKTNKK